MNSEDKTTAKQVIRILKNNEAREKSCSLHEFRQIGAFKCRCKNCGFECDRRWALAYWCGLEHGKAAKKP